MASDNTILVTGATGQQGGAVARHLLKHGWGVRVITRDPLKPAALVLARLGAEVVQADLENRVSLFSALEGVHGVFGVQTNWEAGIEAEIRQGKNLADLSKAAGVRHFVYTSVGGADRKSGVPHFESKAEIERHLVELGLPLTILRPAFFMENFDTVFRPTWEAGGTMELAFALPPDRTLQLVAVDDIGAVVAQVFERPDEFLGRSMEMAGDELTPRQIVAAMSRAIGLSVHFVPVPVEAVRAFNEDMALNFLWLSEHGYAANIDENRKLHPMTDFEMWLRSNGWTNQKALAMRQSA